MPFGRDIMKFISNLRPFVSTIVFATALSACSLGTKVTPDENTGTDITLVKGETYGVNGDEEWVLQLHSDEKMNDDTRNFITKMGADAWAHVASADPKNVRKTRTVYCSGWLSRGTRIGVVCHSQEIGTAVIRDIIDTSVLNDFLDVHKNVKRIRLAKEAEERERAKTK